MTKDKSLYRDVYKTFELDKYFLNLKNGNGKLHIKIDSARSAIYKTISRAYKKNYHEKIWNSLSNTDKDIFMYETLWNNATFRSHVNYALEEYDYISLCDKIEKKREELSIDLANKTIDYINEEFVLDEDKRLTDIKYDKFKNYLLIYNKQYPRSIQIPCISKTGWIILIENGVRTVVDYVANYENFWLHLTDMYLKLNSIVHYAIATNKTEFETFNLLKEETEVFFIDKFDNIWNIVQNLAKEDIDNIKLSERIKKQLADLFKLEAEIAEMITNIQYSVTEEEIDHVAIRVLVKVLSEQMHINIKRSEIKASLQNIKRYNAINDSEVKMNSSYENKLYLQHKNKLDKLDGFYEIDDCQNEDAEIDEYTDWISIIDNILKQ